MKFSDHIIDTYVTIDYRLYDSDKENKFTNISDKTYLKDIVSDINIEDYTFIFELIDKLKHFAKYPPKREYSYLITVRDKYHSDGYDPNRKYKYDFETEFCNRWIYNFDNHKWEDYALKFSICRKSQHKDWIGKYRNYESVELWFIIDEELYRHLESTIPEIFNKNFVITK